MGLLRAKAVPPAPALDDPLAAIPLQPANVELRKDSRGLIHLKMTPPMKPFHRKVARWLRYDCAAKVALDEYGTLFYSLVDGTQTLSAIIETMAQRLDKDRQEAALSVVAFTKSLMTRNLLVLKIPAATPARGAS